MLGLIGLSSTAGLTVGLWHARHRENLSGRWPYLLRGIMGLYAYQVSTSFTATSSQKALSDGATLVFVFFGVGLVRAWELLGLRGGGLFDLLASGVRRAVTGEVAGREPGEDAGPGPGAGAG